MASLSNGNDSNFSGTVIKALDVLDFIAEHRRPMTTQEIAKGCGLSRPTAYRLISTLISRGYLRSIGNFKFTLGTRLLTLSRIVLDDLDLLEVARPYLHELCAATGETANLSILDGGELLYIGKQESPRSANVPMSVQLRSTVGTRIAAHSSAMGKAILAFLSPDELSAHMDSAFPLRRYNRYTITEADTLARELDTVRERGYAIDDREVDEGTRCVGAPIFDSSGHPAAAMSVAGPAYRLSIEFLHSLAPEVVRITQEVSRQVGFTGKPK